MAMPINWQGNVQPTTPNNSMVAFVNDDNFAANYPVGPGMTVALIRLSDNGDGKLFVKRSEMNGMPLQTRIFSIKEITPQAQNTGDMVSRQEFDQMNQVLQSILAKLNVQNEQGGKAK